MRFKELETELGFGILTSIQREDKCKTLIGTKVEIAGAIGDIEENTISLHNFYFDSFSGEGENELMSEYLGYTLYYDSEKFNRQMLAFKPGDGVEITARIKSITSSGSYSSSCKFELITIAKVNTSEERKKAREEAKQKTKEAGRGCFIATACYENYNSPEVLVLRQFRDDKLLKTSFGKVFVKFYYSVSPFFATIISKSELLKKSVRQYFLEPIVAKLQRQNKSK